MTRTIDNEKTQVCCKYKDSTSIIQMNKGHNYVHVSNINLLAAPRPVSFSCAYECYIVSPTAPSMGHYSGNKPWIAVIFRGLTIGATSFHHQTSCPPSSLSFPVSSGIGIDGKTETNVSHQWVHTRCNGSYIQYSWLSTFVTFATWYVGMLANHIGTTNTSQTFLDCWCSI